MMGAPVDNFYPRSPCGERPDDRQKRARQAAISIHALLAESDLAMAGYTKAEIISIHALLAESDFLLMWYQCNTVVFLSTLSLRRATDDLQVPASVSKISIHALLAESDPMQSIHHKTDQYFYPRSPCGERRQPSGGLVPSRPFLSTLSLRRATG